MGAVLAGRFQIVSRLGEGAIGEVYEAADLELEENVAVKVLRPEIARDAEVMRRFKREIQLARKVTHPNVCRTFELFHHAEAGAPGAALDFVTMELLRGETVEQRLQGGGRMLPGEALPLARQMAAGLHAAHLAGVVHRDFKSGNVMLVPSADGVRAVVTDFGLAWSDSGSPAVTRAGMMVGSPAYMAPEQVRGEAVTPATDVYALGIVLYEMVTGTLPFSADTAIGTAIKRLREPPTLPRVHAPDLDWRWEDVILRCLESDPASRFASPPEVVDALEAPRHHSGYVLRAAIRRRRRAWRNALTATVLLAVAAAGWLLRDGLLGFRKPAPATPAAQPAIAVPRSVVAVIRFENLSRKPELAGIETSLEQILPAELAAGERLRIVPGEQVEQARRDLGGLTGRNGFARETLARLRARLGADYVVSGFYLPSARGGTVRIRCVATIQDVRSSEIVDSIQEEGTEPEILVLVDALGARLRRRLGADDLSPDDLQAAAAARPANALAARLYAEGEEKLSHLDALAAAEVLEQARNADPANPLIRAELAAAWDALGDQPRAVEAARDALARSAALGFEPRLRVEARFDATAHQWKKAAAVYRKLWEHFPDDLEHGLSLARMQIEGSELPAALATVARMRSLPSALADDPRIDLTEADAALHHAELARGVAAAERAQRKGLDQGAPLLVARALYFEGIGLRLLGRLPEALAASRQAASLFVQAGDLASEALALHTAGSVLAQQGDLAAARQVFDEMMTISRAIGNEEMVGLGLSAFGMILSGQGDLAEARVRDEKAIAIFHRTGSKRREAMTSANLARVDQRLGEIATARTLYQSAALALGELGDRGSEARVLANEAGLLMDEGDLQPAAELSLRALSLHRAIGGATDIAEDRGIRGRLLHLRGDLPAAEREVTAAVAGLDALGARLAAARQRIELARILIDAGRPAEAKALAETALAALGKTPSPDDEVEARAVSAAAALALGRKDTAEAEARQAVRALAACENRPVRLAAQVVAARVEGAFGSRRAVRELRAIRSEAEQEGLRPLAFEARLALGALDGGAGTAAGRRELSAVLRETSLAGLGGIARRALVALRG